MASIGNLGNLNRQSLWLKKLLTSLSYMLRAITSSRVNSITVPSDFWDTVTNKEDNEYWHIFWIVSRLSLDECFFAYETIVRFERLIDEKQFDSLEENAKSEFFYVCHEIFKIPKEIDVIDRELDALLKGNQFIELSTNLIEYIPLMKSAISDRFKKESEINNQWMKSRFKLQNLSQLLGITHLKKWECFRIPSEHISDSINRMNMWDEIGWLYSLTIWIEKLVKKTLFLFHAKQFKDDTWKLLGPYTPLGEMLKFGSKSLGWNWANSLDWLVRFRNTEFHESEWRWNIKDIDFHKVDLTLWKLATYIHGLLLENSGSTK